MKSKLEYICGRNYNGLSESKHIKYMQRCFALAQQGAAAVHPNPIVGCVIVHDDKIIGEGYHTAYGKPHAEVEAIHTVADKTLLSKSTLYVNLEPCAHFGKTPPCADLIIKNEIQNVVICNVDPHEKVAGLGIARMRAAGINVITGVLEAEGYTLNRSFFTFHTKKRPYIVLKCAETKDGFMGRSADDLETKRISNSLTDRLVHKLRAESGAIIIGTNTAVLDDPSLTTRLVDGRNPLRVVIDVKGRIPATHTIFSDGNENLIIGVQRDLPNTTFIEIPSDNDFWPAVMSTLYERNVLQVLIEGGSSVLDQLLSQQFWDEAYVIQSTDIWKKGIKSPLIQLQDQQKFSIADDTVTHYINR